MAMNRSALWQETFDRAAGRCEFPGCTLIGKVEMAHLAGSGMGGSKYRDVPENVAMLCKHCHAVLDCRLSWKQAQVSVVTLFAAYVVGNPSLTGHLDATQPTTDTSYSDGNSHRTGTSKSSNIASSTGMSQPPPTYTTSTATGKTTGQRTLNTSPPAHTYNTTDSNDPRLTTTKHGDSTNRASVSSPSGNGSAATRRHSHGASVHKDTNSEVQAPTDSSASTMASSSICFFPACDLHGSVNSWESLIPPSVVSSLPRAYRHIRRVALCDHHRNYLTGRIVANARRFENEQILRHALDRPWAGRR